MKNIHDISTMELSKYLTIIRKILTRQGFFEHHIYSTTNYKIENTETFQVSKDLFLRYNPEPDIWSAGEHYDKFFWIGSMFRDEDKITPIHKKEFTVADIYIKGKNMPNVVKLFVKIIRKLENELNLEKLSELPIIYATYEVFEKEKSYSDKKYWLVVTNYPRDESFYDTGVLLNSKTTKFEIFFVDNLDTIEIAACGNLGSNLNSKKFIKDEDRFVNKKVLDKKFIGFGFGVERLIALYKNKL